MGSARRDWREARAKVDREGTCRVCGAVDNLQAAHVIGRSHDPANGKVRPVDVVPLCGPCHMQYDGRSLSLLPYLTHDEQAAAVEHVGMVSAYRRTAATRDIGQIA
jgi:hypothetical protein